MKLIKTPSGIQIAILQQQGIKFLKFEEIVYLKSYGNYTKIFLRNEKCITITKTLKDSGCVLCDSGFFRCHRSYVVNVYHVAEYIRGNEPYFILCCGMKIPVSKRGYGNLTNLF